MGGVGEVTLLGIAGAKAAEKLKDLKRSSKGTPGTPIPENYVRPNFTEDRGILLSALQNYAGRTGWNIDPSLLKNDAYVGPTSGKTQLATAQRGDINVPVQQTIMESEPDNTMTESVEPEAQVQPQEDKFKSRVFYKSQEQPKEAQPEEVTVASPENTNIQESKNRNLSAEYFPEDEDRQNRLNGFFQYKNR